MGRLLGCDRMLEGQPGRWFQTSFEVKGSADSVSSALERDGWRPSGINELKRGNLFWFRFWGVNTLRNRLRTWPFIVELRQSNGKETVLVVVKDNFGRVLLKPENHQAGGVEDWASGQSVVEEGASRLAAELQAYLQADGSSKEQ